MLRVHGNTRFRLFLFSSIAVPLPRAKGTAVLFLDLRLCSVDMQEKSGLPFLACRNKSWVHKFCEMIKALQSFRFAWLLVAALISILQILCVTLPLTFLLFDRLPKTALLIDKTPAKMCKICLRALEVTMGGR